jgi:epsilon-lactone hydrolase
MKTLLAVGVIFLGMQIAGDPKGDSIRVRAFDLPRYSEYLSEETRSGLERMRALHARADQACDLSGKSTGEEIRACEALRYPPILAAARKLYDVEIEPRTIAGVHTDIVTPAERVPPGNQRRVLINIHGGGFRYGARHGGQLAAMPLAAIGKYKVVAVDYRMAPEHHFPAASLDIAAVYGELLKEYDASSIGIYGCSAGGRIAGQTIAWLSKHKLPRPGAVAILCSPPTRLGGDSNFIAAAVHGHEPLVRDFTQGYFRGVHPSDPMAFPGDSDAKLAQFPPTLLMTSTRDYSLSPMVQMHERLVRLGVPADLHIFEGLAHAEFLNMYVPESYQATRIIATFFDQHLSARARAEPRR